jgi:thimet oligopeptidase
MDATARQAFADVIPPDLKGVVVLPEGDIHPEVAIPHLANGYDAAYYTYLWSNVISADLLTRFDKGLLDPEAITAYRTLILEPGRSRPATALVERFLGRPFTLDAWARTRP